MGTVKRLLLAIGVVCIFSTPLVAASDFPTETDKPFVYNVWCRQDALYWGSVVGEASQVRISIGMYGADGRPPVLHAQPQIKILDNWYFFKMKPYRDEDSKITQAKLIIVSMPKKSGDTWKKLYHLSWTEFALVQHTWMVQKNGQSLEFNGRQEWTKRMNLMIDLLRKEGK